MDIAFEAGDSVATKNTSGALIFWAYIAAALFLMGAISSSLLDLWSQTLRRGSPRGGRVVEATFIVLAIASFATLSYNMLNVLILEFSQWLHHSSIARQIPLLPRLWIWSVESSLFVSFAEAITASPARWFWSQAELGTSMVVSCWMGIQGRRERPVPKLWAYFALLQILPTSIVVNLFILARLTAPALICPSKRQVSPNKPFLWLAAIALYFGCLIQAGRNVHGGPQLIKLVLTGRSMLLVPLLLGVRWVTTDNAHSLGERSKDITAIAWFPVALTVALSIAQWCRVGTIAGGKPSLDMLPMLSEIWRVKDEHPAVASLSYDVIQGAVSLLLWQFVGM